VKAVRHRLSHSAFERNRLGCHMLIHDMKGQQLTIKVINWWMKKHQSESEMFYNSVRSHLHTSSHLIHHISFQRWIFTDISCTSTDNHLQQPREIYKKLILRQNTGPN